MTLPGLGTVTVVEIRRDKVRLGFEFDKSIKIHRQEVWEDIQRDDDEPAAQR